MMVEMELLWEDKGWSVGEGFISRLTYISSILARELCARVGELAMPGTKGKDHAIRAGQVWILLVKAIFVSGQEALTLGGGGDQRF